MSILELKIRKLLCEEEYIHSPIYLDLLIEDKKWLHSKTKKIVELINKEVNRRTK